MARRSWPVKPVCSKHSVKYFIYTTVVYKGKLLQWLANSQKQIEIIKFVYVKSKDLT